MCGGPNGSSCLCFSFTRKALTIKQKTQFGVSLKKLVPGRVVRVPVVLERLVQHVETYGEVERGGEVCSEVR